MTPTWSKSLSWATEENGGRYLGDLIKADFGENSVKAKFRECPFHALG